MAASTDLCVVSDVKSYLGLSDSSHDALLASLIAAASEAIENYCRRRFATMQYTEYRDGSDSALLLLDHSPIQSISEIRESANRDFERADPLDEEDYVFYAHEGLLLRTSGIFPEGLRNVRVTYTAGYAAVPADVQHACVALVAAWFNRGHQGGDGLESEQLGDYSARYSSYSLPPEATALLIPYLELCI